MTHGPVLPSIISRLTVMTPRERSKGTVVLLIVSEASKLASRVVLLESLGWMSVYIHFVEVAPLP